jgi:elongation factor P hydroxylase
MLTLLKLINLLNNKYLNQFNTQIVGGFVEPFYKASINHKHAEIQFSYSYIRSALHELSHWCVAGEERRKSDDYGYWYAVDGRNQQQQDEFFKLEIKPQSIEWAFSIICGVEFEASVDNLNNSVKGIDEFNENLVIQMQEYLTDGFSKRVTEIIKLLADNQSIDNPALYISKKIQEIS